MQLSLQPLRTSFSPLQTSYCLLCQWRSFSTSYRRRAEKESPITPLPPPSTSSTLDEAPRAYGKAVSEFTPKSLDRPIGLSSPPNAGENSGIDNRTYRQRRDDFVDYDKHIIRRRELYATRYREEKYDANQDTNSGPRRYQLRTSENGRTCAITRASPFSLLLGCSRQTKRYTSQISTARLYSKRKISKTLRHCLKTKSLLSVSSAVRGRSARQRVSVLKRTIRIYTN